MRRWAAECAPGGRRARDLVTDAAGELAFVLANGHARSAAGTDELLTALGVADIVRDRLPGRPVAIPTLLSALLAEPVRARERASGSFVGCSHQRSPARQGPRRRARADGFARVTHHLAAHVGMSGALGLRHLAEVSEFGVAMLVPAFVVLRELVPVELTTLCPLAEDETPRFAPTGEILAFLRPEHRQLLPGHAAAFVELEPSVRESFTQQVEAFGVRQPEQLQSIVASAGAASL